MDLYNTIKFLGKGAFSDVYLVQDKETEKIYAKKCIHQKIVNLKERELIIMKKINHPNIVRFYNSYEEKESLNIIIEYCEKGDLQEFLNGRKMKEKHALHYFYQILQGLNYLHSNNIIHRDIKPQNILIDKNNVCKIADFGFARYKEEDKLLKTMCGSPLYMAPEIIKKQHYTESADIWSVGVLFFQMLTGTQPFECSNFYELSKLVDEGEDCIKYPPYITAVSRDILQKVLVFDYNERIGIQECIEMVNKAITCEEDIFEMDGIPSISKEPKKPNELMESSESNKLLEISFEPMPESLLDQKIPILPITETSLIRRQTASTEIVLKETECQSFEDWFTIKNSDSVHKNKSTKKMYFSDPLFEIVEATNNVMDDSWRIFKKAGNIISDIANNSV